MLIRRVFLHGLILGVICLYSTLALAGEHEKLMGVWIGKVIDSETKQPIATYTMTFTEDGRLVTTMADDDNVYIYTFNMNFWLEKGLIVFRDEAGKDERAKYRIEGNKLTLEQDGIANVFIRQD